MKHGTSPPTAVRRIAAALCLSALALAGCDPDPFGSGQTLFMLELVEVSGNDQTLAVGGAESAPLVVRVVDQNGSPHRGMVIDWTLVQGTGALSAPSSTSNADGLVQVIYISGEEPGEVVVRASFNPASSGATASREVVPVPFNITVE